MSRLRWLCHFFAKVSSFKICVLVVCGFDWQSSFFQQAFWLVIAFYYLAFWRVLFLPLLKNKLCVKVRRVSGGIFLSKGSGKRAGYPTKRAPDAGDSGEIPSIFLRLIIFPVGRRSAARPSAGNANRWAFALQNVVLEFGKMKDGKK